MRWHRCSSCSTRAEAGGIVVDCPHSCDADTPRRGHVDHGAAGRADHAGASPAPLAPRRLRGDGRHLLAGSVRRPERRAVRDRRSRPPVAGGLQLRTLGSPPGKCAARSRRRAEAHRCLLLSARHGRDRIRGRVRRVPRASRRTPQPAFRRSPGRRGQARCRRLSRGVRTSRREGLDAPPRGGRDGRRPRAPHVPRASRGRPPHRRLPRERARLARHEGRRDRPDHRPGRGIRGRTVRTKGRPRGHPPPQGPGPQRPLRPRDIAAAPAAGRAARSRRLQAGDSEPRRGDRRLRRRCLCGRRLAP